MKKVGLFLSAVALVAGMSAQAAVPMIDGAKKAELNAELAQKMLNPNFVKSIQTGTFVNEASSSMTRSWVDEKTGYEYTATIQPREGDVRDMIRDGDQLSFEDVPFYLADLVLVQRDGDGNPLAVSDMIMVWPSYTMWTAAGSGSFLEAPEGKDMLDIVTLEEMCNTKERVHTFSSQVSSWIYGDVINKDPETGVEIPNMIYGITKYSIVTGMGYLFTATGQESLDIADADSNIDFLAYEAGFAPLCAFNSDQNFTYSNGSRNFTMSVQYNGTGNYMGWTTGNYELELKNQPHVFYMGLMADEEDKDGPLYDGPSYELDKFYLYLPVGNVGVGLPEDMKGKKFDPNASRNSDNYVGFGFTQGTPEDQVNGSYWIWFKGPFYLAKGSQNNPNSILNLYYVRDWEYDNSIGEYPVNYSPVPCSIIPYGIYNSYWSEPNGFFFCYQESATQLVHPTQVGMGCPDGIYVKGVDNFGNTWNTNKYTGNYVFHYNPNDMEEITELPAVVTNPDDYADGVSPLQAILKDGAAVTTGRGLINVASTTDAVAYVYDFAGNLVASRNVVGGKNVNINVAKGVYIVKVGKTVKKVAL